MKAVFCLSLWHSQMDLATLEVQLGECNVLPVDIEETSRSVLTDELVLDGDHSSTVFFLFFFKRWVSVCLFFKAEQVVEGRETDELSHKILEDIYLFCTSALKRKSIGLNGTRSPDWS